MNHERPEEKIQFLMEGIKDMGGEQTWEVGNWQPTPLLLSSS